MKHASEFIVATLLLMLMLYMGSYLALVTPGGTYITVDVIERGELWTGFEKTHYRFASDRAASIFWPLEQIDRKVRAEAWN